MLHYDWKREKTWLLLGAGVDPTNEYTTRHRVQQPQPKSENSPDERTKMGRWVIQWVSWWLQERTSWFYYEPSQSKCQDCFFLGGKSLKIIYHVHQVWSLRNLVINDLKFCPRYISFNIAMKNNLSSNNKLPPPNTPFSIHLADQKVFPLVTHPTPPAVSGFISRRHTLEQLLPRPTENRGPPHFPALKARSTVGASWRFTNAMDGGNFWNGGRCNDSTFSDPWRVFYGWKGIHITSGWILKSLI